jgi:hypothetical protein
MVPAQVAEIETNKALLRAFFRSVLDYMKTPEDGGPGGEVHVTHKTLEVSC